MKPCKQIVTLFVQVFVSIIMDNNKNMTMHGKFVEMNIDTVVRSVEIKCMKNDEMNIDDA